MSDFIIDEDVETIARSLIEKFQDQLSYIDPERLLYVREISRSQKNAPGACRPVKPPYNLLNPDILYIITIYNKSKWDDLTEGQRALLVFHQLLHISPDFDGKTQPHDASDWAFIIDNFGTDYINDSSVPNLLKEGIVKPGDEDV